MGVFGMSIATTKVFEAGGGQAVGSAYNTEEDAEIVLSRKTKWREFFDRVPCPEFDLDRPDNVISQKRAL
jgi:hypothetical protein